MMLQQINKTITWLSLVLLVVILAIAIPLTATAKTPKHYTELEFPPLPEVQLPEYIRYELDNGMVVYLAEDRDLPLIRGAAFIRTGSRFEPSDKVGLGSVTGTLMRSGGTKSHPPERLNFILEQNAASIETGIGTTLGRASFNTLTEDIDTVFPLFAEVLREPAFRSLQLELAINQQRGAIARRNDNPQSITDREFNKLIYGADSPYARTVEYETLDNISRQDIIDFYQEYVRPDNIILGIVGDFDTEEMQTKIASVFADWKVTTPQPKLTIPSATQKQDSGVFLIDRPDSTQSNVMLGHLGNTLDNPDYAALSVMNGVLNGFGGRLFDELRSRQGLAYSVYGIWSPNYDYPGKFTSGGQTQSATTVPFIQAIFREIERLQANPISEEELAKAKESILNSFVFNFQNPSQTISRLMRYEYFDYPQDFIFQYQDQVKATTIEDIQRVALKYLQPEQIVTLVVGNSEEMNPNLKSLTGQIETINIDIVSTN
ncbi:MAG: pitrilysin family protein [Xenococcaceae cyanobacterium MO_207.B15]|nr:pitrilysin family protein [Xenococcaceae cyanobacterium MO_207.B15]MDJ0741851.1 pitrilysin family protein [Xenococcaceae cyanobacterium MO_167.B27]